MANPGRDVPEATIQWLPMLAALLGAGAVGGLLAGLLGVGGGIVIVPALDLALTLAGVDPAVALHVAVATSMATIVPTSISSSRSHAKRGAVDGNVIRRWSLPIVIGSLAGALLASSVDARVLSGVFGVVALLAALKMLLPLDQVVLRPSLPEGIAGAAIPATIGTVSAMMGIGGGTLTVPAMTLCGKPVHKAVGTAALLGLWISVPATLGYLFAGASGEVLPPWTVGHVSLPGFAIVAPVAWLVAPLGARFAHSLDRRRLSAAFGVFLLAVAGRMLYRTFG
jgi:uncharacterized membrane protein YfcA